MIIEVLKELVSLYRRWHVSNRLVSYAVLTIAALVIARCGWAIIGWGVGGEPFRLVQVEGSVTYDDGGVIPGHRLLVTFTPIEGDTSVRRSGKVLPGTVVIRGGESAFYAVTTHRYGDGVMSGGHKVSIIAMDQNNCPMEVVPPEYQSFESTPIKISVSRWGGPLRITVRRPM